MADLISLAYYQLFIGDTDTSKSAQRAQFISAASEAIQKYCHRVLVASEIQELLDGKGERFLPLNEGYPITAITLVTKDPYGETPEEIPGTEFYIRHGSLLQFKPTSSYGCRFFEGEDNYLVNYDAGYNTDTPDEVPDDLKDAVCYVVQTKEQLSDPDVLLTSKQVGDVKLVWNGNISSGAIASDPIFSMVRSLLEPYLLKSL